MIICAICTTVVKHRVNPSIYGVFALRKWGCIDVPSQKNAHFERFFDII